VFCVFEDGESQTVYEALAEHLDVVRQNAATIAEHLPCCAEAPAKRMLRAIRTLETVDRLLRQAWSELTGQ
jgi:hypothetical protein